MHKRQKDEVDFINHVIEYYVDKRFVHLLLIGPFLTIHGKRRKKYFFV